MTTANQAFRQAANSPAVREARDAAKSAADTAGNIGDDVSDFASGAARNAGDFASDVSRRAGREFDRRGAPPPMPGTNSTMRPSATRM